MHLNETSSLSAPIQVSTVISWTMTWLTISTLNLLNSIILLVFKLLMEATLAKEELLIAIVPIQ